jgi:hypothetical protein
MRGEKEEEDKNEESEITEECFESLFNPNSTLNMQHNDDYHNHILGLLRIQKNTNLNHIFYQNSQTVESSVFLNNVFSFEKLTNLNEKTLLPDILMKNSSIF